MGAIARFLGREDGGGEVIPMVGLDEVLAKYDVIETSDDAILVVDPGWRDVPQQLAEKYVRPAPDYRELGVTGHSNFQGFGREDYNSELRWPLNLPIYDKMRRNDGTVRGVMRLVKTPILSASWFIEPASPSDHDVMIAAKTQWALFEGAKWSFKQWLSEVLLMLDYGHYMFEKVYFTDPITGMVRWQKFAPRHPMDVEEFDFDEHGDLKGVWFRSTKALTGRVYIPSWKLLVFTYDQEGGDPRGLSLLRSCYKHWYMKEQLYRIDAIQKERHGIGIPVVKLPPGFKPVDKTKANEMGRNLRTNEKAHVVLPPNWEIMFAKLEGQMVKPLESASHHDAQIFNNMLATFLLNADNQQRAAAVGMQIFTKSTAYIAEIVRDVINECAIPEFVTWNFGPQEDYPELKVRRIGDTTDWRILSFALRNLVGAGILIPDDKLEAHLRNELDLPNADTDTARMIATPQLPGSGGNDPNAPGGKTSPNPAAKVAGLPNQSTTGQMKQGTNPGGSSSGSDSSGTSGTR